jgi:hypothetical protein
MGQPQLAALRQSWIDAGDENEQRKTGEYLIRVLDEDRLSDRPLFPPDVLDRLAQAAGATIHVETTRMTSLPPPRRA